MVHSGPQEGVHTALVPGAVRLRQPRSAHPNPAPSQGTEPWKAAPPTALGESLDSRILVSPLFAPKLSSASELNLVSFYWLERRQAGEPLLGTSSEVLITHSRPLASLFPLPGHLGHLFCSATFFFFSQAFKGNPRCEFVSP